MVTQTERDADLARARRTVARLEARRGPLGLEIPAGYDLDELVEVADDGGWRQVAYPERSEP